MLEEEEERDGGVVLKVREGEGFKFFTVTGKLPILYSHPCFPK